MWVAAEARNDEEAGRTLAALDVLVGQASRATRLLPALVAQNGPTERARCVRAVAAGQAPTAPRWALTPRPVDARVGRAIEQGRRVAESLSALPLAALYVARLDELAIDLAMISAIGNGPVVRALAARRFGTGADLVEDEGGARTPLREIARAWLERTEPTAEPRTLPAEGGPRSMSGALRIAALAAGLELDVRVEPRLTSGAAAGDRTVFVAARRFGVSECVRLVAHEVLGHAVAAANGARSPLRLIETGTAGSFADQEGVAIMLEAEAGMLDDARWRTLAARVVATDRMHAGASFGETALSLTRDLGLPPDLAVVTTERAYRGGGVARDTAYLRGVLRIRAALARGEASLDELRTGRVSLDALPTLRTLGLVHTPHTPRTADVIARVRAALA